MKLDDTRVNIYMSDEFYEFEARVEFSHSSFRGYEFKGTIRVGNDVVLETRDGKIIATITIRERTDDSNHIMKVSYRRAEEIAFLLSLYFKDVFTVKSVNIDRGIKRSGERIEIIVFETIRIVEEVHIPYPIYLYPDGSLRKVEEDLNVLLDKLEKVKLRNEKVYEDFLRIIKWWRKGVLEEDNADKFLHCYIAFENLAGMLGFNKSDAVRKDCERCSKQYSWVKEFAERYSIQYEYEYEYNNEKGKMKINEIRGSLLHAPGPKKDLTEKLTEQIANKFCNDVFKAIEKVLDEFSLA